LTREDEALAKNNLWPERAQAKSDPRENAWHREVGNATRTLRQPRHRNSHIKRAHG
jgi:hypothetical protein